MKIMIKKGTNLIDGYATTGIVEDSIEIDEAILPENFFSDFAENRFIYSDGKVTENPDYKPEPEPEPEPSLEEKLAAAELQIEELTECILEMSEIIYA